MRSDSIRASARKIIFIENTEIVEKNKIKSAPGQVHTKPREVPAAIRQVPLRDATLSKCAR